MTDDQGIANSGEIAVVSDEVPGFTAQGIVPGDPAEWRVTGTPTSDAAVSVLVAATVDLTFRAVGAAPTSGPSAAGSDPGAVGGAADVDDTGTDGRHGARSAWTGTVVPLVTGLGLGAVLAIIGVLAHGAAVRGGGPRSRRGTRS